MVNDHMNIFHRTVFTLWGLGMDGDIAKGFELASVESDEADHRPPRCFTHAAAVATLGELPLAEIATSLSPGR